MHIGALVVGIQEYVDPRYRQSQFRLQYAIETPRPSCGIYPRHGKTTRFTFAAFRMNKLSGIMLRFSVLRTENGENGLKELSRQE